MSILEDEDVLMSTTAKAAKAFGLRSHAEKCFKTFVEHYPTKLQDLYVSVSKSDYEELNIGNACEAISQILEDAGYNCARFPCAPKISLQDFQKFIQNNPPCIIIFEQFSKLKVSVRKAIGDMIQQKHSQGLLNSAGNSTYFSGEDIPGMWDRGFVGKISSGNPSSYQFIFVDGPKNPRQLYSVFYPVLYGNFFPKDSEAKKYMANR